MKNESILFMAGWLRGFFDGEGSVAFRKQCAGRKHTSYYLTVTNTDFELIETCGLYLRSLGIYYTEWAVRRLKNRKPCRTLHIGRAESILRFHVAVNFASPAKRKKLGEIIKWISRPTIDETRLPEISALWQEGHSLRCIGNKLGMKPGHHNKLKQALAGTGIAISPFGRGRKRCGC